MASWEPTGELVGGVHTLVWRSVQVCYELQELEEEDEGREEVQEKRKGESSRGERTDDHAHVDGVKDSNILSHGACADDVTLTRLHEKETVRATLMSMSVEVGSGVRIVQCHAIIDVVIDVRVMQCHASMDVVIGVRVMLCHQAIDNSGFSTFLNFPLRV